MRRLRFIVPLFIFSLLLQLAIGEQDESSDDDDDLLPYIKEIIVSESILSIIGSVLTIACLFLFNVYSSCFIHFIENQMDLLEVYSYDDDL